MALVRVFCGLASADPADRSATAGPTTLASAAVDDAGRLLQICEINDDPAGYARLGAILGARGSGPSGAMIAADSDDHVVTSLLSAAGRPLAIADDDSADDYAERFGDEDSSVESRSTPAQRRAIGLARALQAGVLSATALPPPRDLVVFKPVLGAHAALANSRHAAAAALREVLRELYPAALRAYRDPAEPVPLAILDALPEPGMLAGAQPDGLPLDAIAGQADVDIEQVREAVAALRGAVGETPRRGPLSSATASAVADAVRQAVAAVRACDAGCQALITALSNRATTPPANGSRRPLGRPGGNAKHPAPSPEPSPQGGAARSGRVPLPTRRTRQPGNAGSSSPQPTAPPPVAPAPVTPPPTAPSPVAPPAAQAAPATNGDRGGVSPASGRRAERPGNGPVSAPPPPPGMTRITPGERPPVPPVDAGEPFRPTLTTAALNSARAERQRPTPIVPRQAKNKGEASGSMPGFGATDLNVPVPAPRPEDPAPPGSRANWPLTGPAEEEQAGPEPRHASDGPTDHDRKAEPGRAGGESRVTPPWLADDLPPEPPVLRLVESAPLPTRPRPGDQASSRFAGSEGNGSHLDGPPLRLVEPDRPTQREDPAARRRDIEPSSAPPVSDEGDGDLLIFAATRSAWFVDAPEEQQAEWSSNADSGWAAAERLTQPAVGAETPAGLPRRVPQANLVPGSALRDERPLRIVRDPARMAEHTTGYFRGWRRGQEIGGYAVGGRPGRESAGGWDFSRDHDSAEPDSDYQYRSAGYRS